MRHAPPSSSQYRWLRVVGRYLLNPYLVTTLVITFLWRHVLFAKNLIESADFLVPITMPAFREMFWPFWNARLEFPNIETVDRLAWMAPFLLLPNPLVAQKLMIAAAVLGAGTAMLYAAKRLGAPTFLAVLAAVLFAYNPFVAVRLQHYFQLPGYAVLPAVLALWLRPHARGTPLLLALLLTLGSTTPHYAVYLWSLGALWLVFDFSLAAVRRFGAVFGLYLLFNVYWLVPTALVTRALRLVPSYPTWELLEQFARRATPAAVARLQGYWWPLAEVASEPLVTLAGLGLLAAALVALAVKPDRRRLFLAAGALLYGLIALGTRVPFLASFLSLSGPLATPLGWLFRDPAKATGPMAALLLLLAAQGYVRLRPTERLSNERQANERWAKLNAVNILASVLLAAYGVFALATTGPYLRAVYEPHTPPAGFYEANDWLAGKDGRVLWLPQYYGATAFWNGANLTPEFPTHSSALPVLDPYYYNGRSGASYLSLYFGVLLRKVDADLSKVLRAWDTRWVVHHRDLPPYRLQPEHAFNNQVELLEPSLQSQTLTEAATFSPLTVYDAGAAARSYRPGKVSVTDNPVAALLTLSNWTMYAPEAWSFVETPHEGVRDVALAPGGDARVLLATESHRVDLAQGTVHYNPERYWSKLGETTLDWWPKALQAGLPADETVTLLMTRAPGVRAELPTHLAAGTYRLLVRVYQGSEAGAVRLELGAKTYTLALTAPSLRSAWLDLGDLALGDDPTATLTNLDGFNVVAEVRLIPATAWARAESARAGLEQTWLWPSSTLCRDLRPSEAAAVPVLAEEQNLPFTGTFAGATWNDYQRVTLQVYGDGLSAPLELWTEVQGVWVLLGTVYTWWQGWRTVYLPVKPSSFQFSPGGAFNPASNLKLIVADGYRGGKTVRVRGMRLDAPQTCSLSFASHRAAAATVNLAVTAPVTLTLNGAPFSVSDRTPVQVTLQAGTNRLELPVTATAHVKGIVVSTTSLELDPETAGGMSGETGTGEPAGGTCGAWQLEVLEPFYLPNYRGTVAASTLEPLPVNYRRLGFWRPPGVCGPLKVRNTWLNLGAYSLAVSSAAFGASVVLTLLAARRRP